MPGNRSILQDLEQLRRVLLPCLPLLEQVAEGLSTDVAGAGLQQLVRRARDGLGRI